MVNDALAQAEAKVAVTFQAALRVIDRMQAKEDLDQDRKLAEVWASGDRAEYMRLWRLRGQRVGQAGSCGFLLLGGMFRPMC